MSCLKGHHIQEEKGSRVRRIAAEPMPFECCLFLRDIFLMWTIFTVFITFVTILLLLFMCWFFGRKACGVLFP